MEFLTFFTKFVMQQNIQIVAHPLFFDSLFPSLQSTTPESHISDYRQQKRADSLAEHEIKDQDDVNQVRKFSENNIEFYAEIIGKLVGTVREGVTNLVSTIRERNQQLRNPSQERSIEMKNQKLNSHLNGNLMANAIKMQISNETEPSTTPTFIKRTTMTGQINGTTAESNKIELTLQRELENGKNPSLHTEDESIPIGSWNDVVQVIAKRPKQKRSETSMNAVTQLEIPIDSIPPIHDGSDDDHDKMTNEPMSDNEHQYMKLDLLSILRERHRQRKAKLIRLMLSFILTPSKSSSHMNLSNETSADGRSSNENLTNEESSNDISNLSFALLRGNSTIVHVAPIQVLRMFKHGTEEHTKLQLKAKWMLQKTFYKYARLFLIARKGYKDVSNHQHDDETEEDEETSFNESKESGPQALHSKFDDVDGEELFEDSQYLNDTEVDEADFMTNGARMNLQTIEAFAILLIEILGALYTLSIGTISHIEAGHIFGG